MKGKQIWSQQEDYCLKSIVFQAKQIFNWTAIAQKLNIEFPNKNRSAKQCRERYVNHTSLDENHSLLNIWTPEQNNALFQLFERWGSKWTKISQQIKGKSQNCVKNRFYGSLRKALRKMNRASKNLIKKFKKQVKYESITRIIDASEGLFRLRSPLKQESEHLSRKILNLAQNSQEQIPSSQAQELIIEINKFNMATRSYKSKKKIKNSSPCQDKIKIKSIVKKQKCSSSSTDKSSGLQQERLSQRQQQSSIEQQDKAQNEDGNNQLSQKIENSSSEGLVEYTQQEQPNFFECSYFQIEDYFNQAYSPLEFQAWI